MSFSAETNNSMLPVIYSLSLNTMVSLPNIAIIADLTKNTNINQKDKLVIYLLTVSSILAIFYSKETMPLGIILSIVSIIMMKKLDNDINCVLYSTLLTHNVLLSILMSIQYLIKNN